MVTHHKGCHYKNSFVVADKVRKVVMKEPIIVKGEQKYFPITAGISLYPEDVRNDKNKKVILGYQAEHGFDLTTDEGVIMLMFQMANEAMYKGKKASGIKFFDDEHNKEFDL